MGDYSSMGWNNEEFFEKETKEYIRDEDIMAWWEDKNNG